MAENKTFERFTVDVHTDKTLKGMVTIESNNVSYTLMATSKDGKDTLGGVQHNNDQLTNDGEDELRTLCDTVAKSIQRINELSKPVV